MAKADKDLFRHSNRFAFTGDPAGTGATDATGVLHEDLPPGRYVLYSNVDAYFVRGASGTLQLSDCDADEATPTLSYPLPAKAFVPIDVTGTDNDAVAIKKASTASDGVHVIGLQAKDYE